MIAKLIPNNKEKMEKNFPLKRIKLAADKIPSRAVGSIVQTEGGRGAAINCSKKCVISIPASANPRRASIESNLSFELGLFIRLHHFLIGDLNCELSLPGVTAEDIFDTCHWHFVRELAIACVNIL